MGELYTSLSFIETWQHSTHDMSLVIIIPIVKSYFILVSSDKRLILICSPLILEMTLRTYFPSIGQPNAFSKMACHDGNLHHTSFTSSPHTSSPSHTRYRAHTLTPHPHHSASQARTFILFITMIWETHHLSTPCTQNTNIIVIYMFNQNISNIVNRILVFTSFSSWVRVYLLPNFSNL